MTQARKLTTFAATGIWISAFFLSLSCSHSSEIPPQNPAAVQAAASTSTIQSPGAVQQPLKTLDITDFENGNSVNRLGGASGSWNMDTSDINNSYTDDDFVEIPGPDGKRVKVLRLRYSVDSDKPSQNGYWTKLMDVDAEDYDHLDFELKGDPAQGFTDRFKIELKKCKGMPCTGDPVTDEVIKGTFVVPVTSEWQTVSIPLNKITGVIDFMDQESWKNPAIARKGLDELVVIFQDRMVSKKHGTIYIRKIRFSKTGNPGPTAVDFPKHSRLKTPTILRGLDYARFLAGRLGGFPKQLSVKKKFPEKDAAFLREIAKDTWRFFEEIVDKESGLPLDTIQLGETAPLDEKTVIGDYTNVTNIGVYFMAVVSAYDLGFIDKKTAVEKLRKTLSTVDRLEHHSSGWPYNYYDTTLAEKTSFFLSLVDGGWLLAGYYVVKNAFPDELGPQAQKAIDRAKLSFFYNPLELQMRHGYYAHLEVYSDYHYGSFYTEPRVASYMAIARGEVPREHWFRGLVRTFPESFRWQGQAPAGRVEKTTEGFTYFGGYYEWKDLKYVPSWGGSAFEALMPTLVLDEKKLAPQGLGLNDERHAVGQKRFSLEEAKQPVWGMSPCSVPEGGYSEYGAKPFGSKGYKGGVVTPHASVLALEFIPQDVLANLRRLIELYDIYGEYGFYDAVNTQTGQVARKYLALDQAMILVAINNYLNQGAIRNRFHADPVMKSAEDLLTSEKLFQ